MKEKYIKVFYNNNFDKVRVVLCCFFHNDIRLCLQLELDLLI